MKKTALATAIVSLLSHAYTSPVFAQNTTTETDETMVVTANRFEQSESSVLASVSVITKEEIESSKATSTLDLLKSIPGVLINQQGTKGNVTGIYIRGTSTKHALVLIDGVRINSPKAGGASIGLIPTFAIESIEIIRGPRAALYGSDAMGGVISIKTVPQEKSVHELLIGYGSENQNQQGWRSVGDISDSTKGSFVVNQEKSDGYRIYDAAGQNDTYGYDSQTLFGSLQHKITEQWTLGFSGYSQDSKSEYSGQFDGKKNQADINFYSIGSELSYQNDYLRSTFQLNSIKDDSADGDAAGLNAKTTLTAYRNSFSWINTYTKIENLTLNLGIDSYQEKAERGGTNTIDYVETERNNKAVFMMGRIDLGDLTSELSIRYDDDSSFGDNSTWNAAIGYYFIQDVQLVISSGIAFKAPTFNDMYWPSSGNPDLKAEESQSSEIAIYGDHSLFSWSVVAYRSDIDNLIEWADDGTGAWKPQNVNKAEVEGLEVTIDFSTGVIEHSISAEWLEAVDKETKEDLIRRPKEKYNWTSSVGFNDVDVYVSALYTGERYANSSEIMDAYITVDLGLGYQVTESLDLGLRINNLLDKEYVTAYGANISGNNMYYLGEERSFFATAKYKF